MSRNSDVAVIGAGPAGMAASIAIQAGGARAVLFDDQPAPGGQVWRGVESVGARGQTELFGEDFERGAAAVARFRDSGVTYRPNVRVIGVETAAGENGCVLLTVENGQARRARADALVIAAGAYERPTPFPGWTLPGVMTVGAAQIALKTADMVPAAPFVLAGQGPLLLLFAWQLRRAGVAPAAILLMDDPRGRRAAIGRLPRAVLSGVDDLAKGLKWAAGMNAPVKNVVALAAEGGDALERVSWRTAGGASGAVDARALLVHDGVVPNAQLTRAMRLPHSYDPSSRTWRPDADMTTGAFAANDRVFVAGDCAGVNGWKAAEAMGACAAAAVLRVLGLPATDGRFRARLARSRATRPLLDALYPPARAFDRPDDPTLVCRCEEVTAGEVRAAARLGAQGPNQLKAFTRAGMGPCQGRLCAMTTARILAAAQDRPIADVGLQRTRMPIFPVSIGEMGGLNETPMRLPRS